VRPRARCPVPSRLLVSRSDRPPACIGGSNIRPGCATKQAGRRHPSLRSDGGPMSNPRAHHIRAVSLVSAILACGNGSSSVAPHARNLEAQTPALTTGTSQSTPLARATFGDPSDPLFKLTRISDDWHVAIESTPAFDVAVQSIVFQPGTHSGW